MKMKDVEVGMRVVPFQKTAEGFERNFELWKNKDSSLCKFFRDHGYVYVSEKYSTGNCVVLAIDKDSSGDFFNPSDFNPFFEASNFWESFYLTKPIKELEVTKIKLSLIKNEKTIITEQIEAIEKIISFSKN